MPYLKPTNLPVANDFANKVFIDPLASPGGNGSIESPLQTHPVNYSSNTAYLQKKGTVLNKRVSKTNLQNIYFGSYGEGEKPKIIGGFNIQEGSFNVILVDLHSQAESFWSEGWDAIVNVGTSNGGVPGFCIKDCIVEGLFNESLDRKWPNYGLKMQNGTHNATIFNNEFKSVWRDGITANRVDNCRIVRNLLRDLNKMSIYVGTDAWGDGIEFTTDTPGLYLAGNYIDKSGTPAKFGLIHVAGFSSIHRNITIEYNTILGPISSAAGGGVVFYGFPAETIFRYNVIDASAKNTQLGHPPLTHSNIEQNLQQIYPFGIHYNHLIKAGDNYTWVNSDQHIPASNLLHNGYSEYVSFMLNNPTNNWGSDIDPDTFWNPMEEKNGLIDILYNRIVIAKTSLDASGGIPSGFSFDGRNFNYMPPQGIEPPTGTNEVYF